MLTNYRDDDASFGEPLTVQILLVSPEGDTDEMSYEIVQTIETDLRLPSAGMAANPYRDAD